MFLIPCRAYGNCKPSPSARAYAEVHAQCMHSACTHIWPTGHVIVRISGDLKATAYLALGSQQFSKLRPNQHTVRIAFSITRGMCTGSDP